PLQERVHSLDVLILQQQQLFFREADKVLKQLPFTFQGFQYFYGIHDVYTSGYTCNWSPPAALTVGGTVSVRSRLTIPSQPVSKTFSSFIASSSGATSSFVEPSRMRELM